MTPDALVPPLAAPVRPARSMRRELARKSFHMSSTLAPLLVWLLPRPIGLLLLVPAAAIAVTVDVARLRVRGFRYHFLRLTRTMLRHHERRGITGGTWMALSYAIALLILPKPIAVMAMLFNGLGDAAAALVGKRYGRHRTSWGKSWEGFAAAFVTCLAIGLTMSYVAPELSPAGAAAGALAAAALEFAPLPLDDNVRVTLGGGITAWLVSLL
ncbi:MAG TPA: SEC59/DGK1/VTE5 family protein, partial [Longimicrobiaceae bacterium]|nr:SEC59/DGK1/VTE5 family protein [Longimicrobiaceae bacterium]